MVQTRRSPGHHPGAPSVPARDTVTVTDPAADLFAWTGVFLDDGRVISIAWLRAWPGAVASRWRRYR